jgi:3-oxoacyl-[acyl-carrier-protein] synthase-3
MKLRAVAAAVPDRRVSAEEIAAWTGGEAAFIADKIGIRSRAFLGPGETGVSLAQRACDRLFAENPELQRDRVGLLIMVTQNPDYRLPHSSALLQAALGLGTQTACFDLGLGCSGYVYGLTVAKGFMAAEGITDGLLVTCDPYSKIMARTDRDTVSVFGDAATATWLSAESGGTLGLGDHGTDGGGAQHLTVRGGGSACPVSELWEEGPAGGEPLRLHMNGRAIFNFMMERVPQSVTRCLARNGLAPGDVDHFVFHQASKFLLDNLRSRLRLDPDKVPCEIADVGNTVSSSIPLALSRLKCYRGSGTTTVLVSGFGVGLSWATNIIRFRD